MNKNAIHELNAFGQSVWLDDLSRSLIKTGKLKEMIGLGLTGMTSNPTIFDKAISSSADYDEQILGLRRLGKSTFEIYDELTITDVRDAADLLRSVYEETAGRDGYVSLEINPKLADKTKETIVEGKRLHKKVNRPNVMFKVPATEAGFGAIEELTASGINVNITLIFSVRQYVDTTQAYLRGIERFMQDQGDAEKVFSVASVFVSRIDTLTAELLDKLIGREKDQKRKSQALSLKGKAAVANSRLCFRNYLEIFTSEDFKELKEGGANIQRLLWGSTSTKNPASSDIKYVAELIGKGTINTMPEKTFYAFLDHGRVKEALIPDTAAAQESLTRLRNLGISIDEVCLKLLEDGVLAFDKSLDNLLNTIDKKTKSL